MKSLKSYEKVANQFVITTSSSVTFQSYQKIIAKTTAKNLYIDTMALEYSQTTLKYLKQFLNTCYTKKQLQAKFKTGNFLNGKKIIIKNLNK